STRHAVSPAPLSPSSFTHTPPPELSTLSLHDALPIWPFFALEYVEGGSLDRHLAGTPQPAREAAALAETLARAVHYAHQRGIVHRDLKPANILLALSGRPPGGAECAPPGGRPLNEAMPKITDFGLARVVGGAGNEPRGAGATRGPPGYGAPERPRGRAGGVGPGTAVYARGAALYELPRGRPPFKATSGRDPLQRVVLAEPLPPSR